MPAILTNGVRLHLVELGAGPPVVMLHGLLVGNLATWYLTAAPALSRSHRVLVYDLRGHGRSERPPTGYDVPTMVDDLRGLLDRCVPGQPVDLVGHSYGALIALQLALDAPARVRRLALVEAPLAPSDTRALTAWLDRPPDALVRALPAALQADLARGGRRARRLLASLQALATETTVLSDIAAQQEVPDARLASLSCPLLAVYGRASSCRPHADRLRRLLPAARVAELDGGHYLPLDAPAELTALLEEFLRG
ncbi:MAG: alpha/beta hydrolase [Deltaproteobacteria bacterium]|nr:MAG: alpha/beta hydrolase [Deltaproteobacteria bacterium]